MQWLWAVGLFGPSFMAVAEPLRLGFGTNKPPYVFEGEARGLEYEIVVAAAQRAGLLVEVSYAPMERLHLMLRRGLIDAIATTNTQSGISAFYSEPYITYQNVAVALRERHYNIQRIADLGQYSVSAFQRARFLLGNEFQRMAESNPRYHEEARQIARNRLLYSGRIDVVVADMRIFRYFNRDVTGSGRCQSAAHRVPGVPADALSGGLRTGRAARPVRPRTRRDSCERRVQGHRAQLRDVLSGLRSQARGLSR